MSGAGRKITLCFSFIIGEQFYKAHISGFSIAAPCSRIGIDDMVDMSGQQGDIGEDIPVHAFDIVFIACRCIPGSKQILSAVCDIINTYNAGNSAQSAVYRTGRTIWHRMHSTL